MVERMPKNPDEWKAHDDAYSLMRAAEVRQDEDRLKAALDWVEYLAEETQNKAKAVKSLVNENKKFKQ